MTAFSLKRVCKNCLFNGSECLFLVKRKGYLNPKPIEPCYKIITKKGLRAFYRNDMDDVFRADLEIYRATGNKHKVESFRKFNGGMKRPNHREHLRLCGFKVTRIIHPEDGKPSLQAMEYLVALGKETNCFYHGVLRQRVDCDGWTYYELWRKDL